MPKHAGACRNMPEHAGACRSMPEHAGTCRSMPEHAGACRRVHRSQRLAQRPAQRSDTPIARESAPRTHLALGLPSGLYRLPTAIDRDRDRDRDRDLEVGLPLGAPGHLGRGLQKTFHSQALET
eukprot:CAMPEP_0181231764 /NCGR_PEP_ID=MMETSP1096-20121128/35307_1 /TAXON_ID=156174 ORGANISM="Chrysochromulina ericina, Strain CCMP281" /NCGR_SAMPLE_ID=MMETSP1096 /ASSEMBLY_ACC=CAM_ASM_000453 /LENGTH=123 /DNA_ID=CAMNT_0023325881 /DNA_START=654 /DNA_END=1025 /DNA_ORIENTATION=+